MSIPDPSLLGRGRALAGRALRSSPHAVQSVVRRAAGALDPPRPTAAPATPDDVWHSPPVPLPDGVTLADLTAMFRTWSVNGEPPGHLDAYVDDSLWRFCHTWALVRDERGPALELGANPYFTTELLTSYTELDLTLANYYGNAGETTETVSYVPIARTAGSPSNAAGFGSDPSAEASGAASAASATKRVERKYESVLFNVEEERFPFDSDTFAVVLFCEIIEHLLMNPLATLREIHRVLRPDGLLVVTTPNVARIDNVMAMVHGVNIYDPYSGFGPYGRHNREYTRHELHRILEFAGYTVETSHTADGHPYDPERWPRRATIAPLVEWRQPDLGHYLFARARRAGPPREGLPSSLYRSWPAGAIVDD
jgi:SAM-dependent methyltransferase